MIKEFSPYSVQIDRYVVILHHDIAERKEREDIASKLA